MLAEAASWIAALGGLWLIALGVFMFSAPRRSLKALAAMGGSGLIHFGEMAVRIAAGAVFIIAAPVTRIPAAYAFFGWFLVGSALVLVLLPRRWHASYSSWWADRISPPAVRIIAPISVIAGGLLIWTLLYR